MKKYVLLIIVFEFLNTCLYCQNDFFPLKVKNKWTYSYNSHEIIREDIVFISKITNESGNISFIVTDSLNQDSVKVWSILENDVIEKRVQDYVFKTDITQKINVTNTFRLYEYFNLLHTLKSISYYEVFNFPVRWESSVVSTTPITRFNNSTSVLTVKENKNYTFARYIDSLVFQKDIGLVYAKSIRSVGQSSLDYSEWEASLSSFITNVDNERSEIPERFSLSQNYPNPFNPETIISFTVSERTKVTITVYDILGRVISILANEEKNPGEYKIIFEPKGISSGVFIYQLKTSQGVLNRKMTYIK